MALSGTFSVGLEIKIVWAEKLLRGQKSIEARGYSLPEDLQGRRIWLLATGGAEATSIFSDHEPAGAGLAQIVGWFRCTGSSRYQDREAWVDDRSRHCVLEDSPYDWHEGDDAELYGWVIAETGELREPKFLPASSRLQRSLRELECTDADLLETNAS